MAMPEAPARFSAYAPDQTAIPHHMMPEAQNFEDAAVYFADIWHPALDAAGRVKVMVTDRRSGETHCFQVDVGAGEALRCTEAGVLTRQRRSISDRAGTIPPLATC